MLPILLSQWTFPLAEINKLNKFFFWYQLHFSCKAVADFVFWFFFCFFLSSTNALIRKKLWNLNSFNYVISNTLNDFYWNKTPAAIDDYYGCLFVAKLSWRKIFFFFWKGICVSYKIYIICKKNVLIWNKSFILKKKILYFLQRKL